MKKMENKINEVYKFVCDFIEENGYSPSVRDVAKELNIKSTATVYSYLKKLNERELIVKSPLKKRAIRVNKPQNDYKSAPLIGTVAAGQPIFAQENFEDFYPISPDFNCGEDAFALRVKGDSMINAGIYDKDIILVEKCQTAENGDIVVALVEDSATVKRFYKKNGKIILHPENSDMQDMIFDSVSILGKVKGLYRKI